jgi:DNA polymerase
MFVGEAPGAEEDRQGLPFVGRAGKLLDQLLAEVGLAREEVFIANVLKHRPPDNRDPMPDEIAACNDYLDRQIAIIDPKVICTLGRFSMAKFFPGERISRIHGVARRYGNRLILPFYHPAAALHQGSLRRTVEDDFKRLPAVIAEAQKLAASAPTAPAAPVLAQPPEPEPKQLSLF